MNTTMNLPTRKKPEVLSPAGNLRGLKTAVDYGADAVYCGGKAFGMRSVSYTHLTLPTNSRV